VFIKYPIVIHVHIYFNMLLITIGSYFFMIYFILLFARVCGKLFCIQCLLQIILYSVFAAKRFMKKSK